MSVFNVFLIVSCITLPLSNLDSKFSTLDQAKYKIDYESKNNDPHYESTIYGK